jgi:hypothetical protein
MSNHAQLAIILGICIAIGALIIAALMRSNLARGILARSWPTTNGTIVGGNVRNTGGRPGEPNFAGEAAYSYQVEGEYYSGYETRVFWDEQRAWDFVDNWKGRAVIVRYKPSHPEISVLRQKDQASTL